MNHNKDQSKFEIKDGDHTSELIYAIDDTNKTMAINKTFVPNELRGKGLAGALNKAALAYAEEKKLTVIPVCSYTAGYLKRHPEFEHLVKKKS